MYIDKHYPFEMIPLKYPLTSFSDFLDFQTLSIIIKFIKDILMN